VDYLTDEQRSYGDKEPVELGADLQFGPLGIQHFDQLISRGAIYLDKTPLICELLNQYQAVFLARPAVLASLCFCLPLPSCLLGGRTCSKFFGQRTTGIGIGCIQ
jgi:hypothetical protein